MALRRWPVALVGLLLLVIVGCSNDGSETDPDPDPTPSVTAPSPTESKTPDEPFEPEPPAAMDHENEEGAEAFIQYYWDVVNFAQATGDVKLLKRLALPTCTACDAGVGWIVEAHKSGGTVKGGEYSTASRKVKPLADAEGTKSFHIAFELSSTKQRVLDRNGKVVERHRGGTVQMALVVGQDESLDWRVAMWEKPS